MSMNRGPSGPRITSRGDVEGALQPAERVAAEGRDVVYFPHVPGHPA
jgi:hypothetical protein